MSDEMLNPVLRSQVRGLRGCIFGAATSRNPLPSHYTVTPVDGKPMAEIMNIETGESIQVALCDLKGAIQAISAFGE